MPEVPVLYAYALKFYIHVQENYFTMSVQKIIFSSIGDRIHNYLTFRISRDIIHRPTDRFRLIISKHFCDFCDAGICEIFDKILHNQNKIHEFKKKKQK